MLYFNLYPEINEELDQLKNSFTSFLKNQTDLDSFKLEIDLKEKCKKKKHSIEAFTVFPEFIKENKRKLEDCEKFYVEIIGIFFAVLYYLNSWG